VARASAEANGEQSGRRDGHSGAFLWTDRWNEAMADPRPGTHDSRRDRVAPSVLARTSTSHPYHLDRGSTTDFACRGASARWSRDTVVAVLDSNDAQVSELVGWRVTCITLAVG
jgi:hypothetical protein